MLVPLHGFLLGDTLGIVLLVQHDDPVSRIAQVLMEAAAPRVAPAAGGRVFFNGRELPADVSVSEAGLTALDRVDVHPFAEDP